MAALTAALQAGHGRNVRVAIVDQSYTLEESPAGARQEVVKHQQAKRDFVLLPRCRVVECKLCVGRTVPPVGARSFRTQRQAAEKEAGAALERPWLPATFPLQPPQLARSRS